MSQALPRIYMAIGMKGMEDFLKQKLKNEYRFVGEAIYREQVVKNAIPANPDIIILRETLNGSKGILDIVYELRLQLPDTRIIFLASDRKPGDPLLAELVSNGVYDIMTGNQISAPDLINLIREPNKFSDVAMFRPKAKVNERTKEVLYDVPVKEVVKPVKKTVFVEGTPVLPPDYGKNVPKQKKKEEDEPKIKKRRNRRRFLSKFSSEPETGPDNPPTVAPVEETDSTQSPEPEVSLLDSGPESETRTEPEPTQATQHEPKTFESSPLFEVEDPPATKTEPNPAFEPETKPLLNFEPGSEPEPSPEPRSKPFPDEKREPSSKSVLAPVSTPAPAPVPTGGGKQKILTFVGGDNGVGNTQTAFNTALTLGKRGFRTIFIELRDQGSTIEYLYQLALMDKGLDVALKCLSQENFVGLDDAIIRMSEVRQQNTNAIMADNYRKFPDSVDFLFFSPDYVLERDPEKKKIDPSLLKELCMHLIFQSGYHYIVLDAEPDLFNPYTEVALGFGTHIFFTVTQDVCHIGRAVRNISEVTKRINVTDKLYYILNKYDGKAALSKRDIEDWLKQDVETTIPLLHRDFINANMKGVPVLFHSQNPSLKKAFNEIIDHILQK